MCFGKHKAKATGCSTPGKIVQPVLQQQSCSTALAAHTVVDAAAVHPLCTQARGCITMLSTVSQLCLGPGVIWFWYAKQAVKSSDVQPVS